MANWWDPITGFFQPGVQVLEDTYQGVVQAVAPQQVQQVQPQQVQQTQQVQQVQPQQQQQDIPTQFNSWLSGVPVLNAFATPAPSPYDQQLKAQQDQYAQNVAAYNSGQLTNLTPSAFALKEQQYNDLLAQRSNLTALEQSGDKNASAWYNARQAGQNYITPSGQPDWAGMIITSAGLSPVTNPLVGVLEKGTDTVTGFLGLRPFESANINLGFGDKQNPYGIESQYNRQASDVLTTALYGSPEQERQFMYDYEHKDMSNANLVDQVIYQAGGVGLGIERAFIESPDAPIVYAVAGAEILLMSEVAGAYISSAAMGHGTFVPVAARTVASVVENPWVQGGLFVGFTGASAYSNTEGFSKPGAGNAMGVGKTIADTGFMVGGAAFLKAPEISAYVESRAVFKEAVRQPGNAEYANVIIKGTKATEGLKPDFVKAPDFENVKNVRGAMGTSGTEGSVALGKGVREEPSVVFGSTVMEAQMEPKLYTNRLAPELESVGVRKPPAASDVDLMLAKKETVPFAEELGTQMGAKFETQGDMIVRKGAGHAVDIKGLNSGEGGYKAVDPRIRAGDIVTADRVNMNSLSGQARGKSDALLRVNEDLTFGRQYKMPTDVGHRIEIADYQAGQLRAKAATQNRFSAHFTTKRAVAVEEMSAYLKTSSKTSRAWQEYVAGRRAGTISGPGTPTITSASQVRPSTGSAIAAPMVISSAFMISRPSAPSVYSGSPRSPASGYSPSSQGSFGSLSSPSSPRSPAPYSPSPSRSSPGSPSPSSPSPGSPSPGSPSPGSPSPTSPSPPSPPPPSPIIPPYMGSFGSPFGGSASGNPFAPRRNLKKWKRKNKVMAELPGWSSFGSMFK